MKKLKRCSACKKRRFKNNHACKGRIIRRIEKLVANIPEEQRKALLMWLN